MSSGLYEWSRYCCAS